MRHLGEAIISPTVALVTAGSAWAAVTVQGEARILSTPEERKLIREYYAREIVEQAGKGKK